MSGGERTRFLSELWGRKLGPILVKSGVQERSRTNRGFGLRFEVLQDTFRRWDLAWTNQSHKERSLPHRWDVDVSWLVTLADKQQWMLDICPYKVQKGKNAYIPNDVSGETGEGETFVFSVKCVEYEHKSVRDFLKYSTSPTLPRLTLGPL